MTCSSLYRLTTENIKIQRAFKQNLTWYEKVAIIPYQPWSTQFTTHRGKTQVLTVGKGALIGLYIPKMWWVGLRLKICLHAHTQCAFTCMDTLARYINKN